MILRFAPLLCAALLAVVGAGAAQAQPSATPVHTIKVTAKDFGFVLSTSTVAPGRVKFVIKNIGSSEHDFAIAGHTSKTVEPGQSKTLMVTLKKGKYPFLCARRLPRRASA